MSALSTTQYATPLNQPQSPSGLLLKMVGLGRFELPTPRLSSVCSNQLSYRPSSTACSKSPGFPVLSKLDRTQTTTARCRTTSCEAILLKHQIDPRIFPWDIRPCGLPSCGSSRKEVIQPQVLLQLPCYDFTPITDHTLSACLPCGLAERFLVQPAFVM